MNLSKLSERIQDLGISLCVNFPSKEKQVNKYGALANDKHPELLRGSVLMTAIYFEMHQK